MPEYTNVKQWNINAFPTAVRDEIIEAAKVRRETVTRYIEVAHRLRQQTNAMPMDSLPPATLTPAPVGPLDVAAYLDAVTRLHVAAQNGAPIPRRWLSRVRGYLPPAAKANKDGDDPSPQLKIDPNRTADSHLVTAA